MKSKLMRRHKRHVGLANLKDGKIVSTVRLRESPVPGFHHKYETMVFPNSKNLIELDRNQYKTVEEAKRGHKSIVAKYKKLIAKAERK